MFPWKNSEKSMGKNVIMYVFPLFQTLGSAYYPYVRVNINNKLSSFVKLFSCIHFVII